jgi:hypothetical protein
MTEQKLGDLARETVAAFKYNGHKSRRDAEIAACADRIAKAKRSIRDLVMEASTRGMEQLRLTDVGGACVADTSDRVQHRNMSVVCPQCLAFMQQLREEGFGADLKETKDSYFIDISWKEEE